MRYAAYSGSSASASARMRVRSRVDDARRRRRGVGERVRVVVAGVVGAVQIAVAMLLWPLWGRRWMRWGALDGELRMALPCETGRQEVGGDGAEVIEVVTRAITIHADVGRVWPWVKQIGGNKGGFYSYEALQNVIGCRVRNCEAIVEEWQRLEVGDRVVFHPAAAVQRVTALVEGQALEVGGWWSWVAMRAVDGTRVVVRTRIARRRGGWGTVGWWVVGAMHFVMERRMLLGLRRVAERWEAEVARGVVVGGRGERR